MPKRKGRKSASQTPSPAKDIIYGSKKNPQGSASSEKSAKDIKLSPKVIIALNNKLKEFRETHKTKKISLADLKAVYRRGAGAYSKSHRPTISGGKPNTRNAWAMARVNKFLEKASGKKVKEAYVQDDDLLKMKEGGEVSLIENRIYAIRGKFNGKSRFIEEVTFLKGNKNTLSFSKLSNNGKILEYITAHPREIKVYKRVQGEWSEIDPFEIKNSKQYADGGMVAPNGKKSNLTPEQYKLVRTPEFKAWFGDWEKDPQNSSKVVDENGEPLVVYHGTTREFNVFKPTEYKRNFGTIKSNAFFFAKDRIVAEYIAELKSDKNSKKIILPFFLNIRNLLNFSDVVIVENVLPSLIGGLPEDDLSENIGYLFYVVEDKEILDKIKKMNYDGVQLIEGYLMEQMEDLEGDIIQSYAVFNPNQIKIADGSNTTFDGSNPDIRYDNGGATNQKFIIVIRNIKNPNDSYKSVKNKYRGAYEKIFNILNDDSVFFQWETSDEEMVGNDFYIKFESKPDSDKIEKISKIPNVEIIDDYAGGGEVSGRKGFYDWFCNWYKGICDKVSIFISFPNQISGLKSIPEENENAVILDLIEKVDPNIDAKVYLQKIVDKADEYGVTIYLQPLPRYVRIKDEAHKKKLTKEYLAEYYKKFGFKFTKDKDFMKREPQMKKGGEVGVTYFIGKPEVDIAGRFSKKRATWKTCVVDENGNKNYSHYTTFFHGSSASKLKLDGIRITQKEFDKLVFDNKKYNNGGEVEERKKIYKKWRSLVNMSYGELKKFYDSKEGKEAGLSSSEAKEHGIDSGRESARWIMKMKKTPSSQWTDNMWRWANKQISFISRMSGNKGGLYDDKGRKTRKHTSLLIWGHNPEKYKDGGFMPDIRMEDTITRIDDPRLADISMYGDGGKTDEVRNFYKKGKWKYVLINVKRSNNFSKWSNKKESLQKFIDDIKDSELASEFMIYETKITETSGKRGTHNVPYTDSSSYFEIKKMADGGRINYSEYYKEGGKVDSCEKLDKNGERKIDEESIKKLTMCVNGLPQTKDFHFHDGRYDADRRELHKKIIYKIKKDLVCIENDKPIAILMGGSPASGKSTFLKKYRPYLLENEILKVDADEIRSQLPEYKGFNATQTHLETKDIVNLLLSDRNIGIPCRFDLIYDGTMNNTKSYIPLITLLKSLGYRIFVVYIDKVPKDVIVKRALERYKKSGRFVPLEVIDDFFSKGKDALNQIKQEVDGYMIVDGSNSDYNVIEKGGMQLPKNRRYSKLGDPITITSEDVVREYKSGGELDPDNPSIKNKVVHNSGKVGGMLVGNRHSEGGIKAINKSNGQPLEMEGGEVVITRNAVSDNKKREFEGKMMTNREILSKINESGGGVSFAKGGDVKSDCGCNHYDNGGDINKIKNKYPQEFKKGIKEETREHIDTFGDISRGKISLKKAVEQVVAKHLSEKPNYYKNYEKGGYLSLTDKMIPSLEKFLDEGHAIYSPFKGDDNMYYQPHNPQSKDNKYHSMTQKKVNTISNLLAYETYLYDKFGILFSNLPTQIQNALTLGKQALIDNYINS